MAHNLIPSPLPLDILMEASTLNPKPYPRNPKTLAKMLVKIGALQVLLRGYHIALGDVETVLETLNGVEKAVALVQDGALTLPI